jgi:hypothetical protein
MGASISKSDVDICVSDMVEVLNTYNQSCWGEISGTNIIDIENSDHVDVNGNVQTITASMSISCTADLSSNTDVKSDLETIADNHSDAVKKGLALGVDYAEQYTKLAASLTTIVANTYTQQTIAQAQYTNVILVNNSTNVDITNNNQANVVTIASKSVMVASDVTNVTDQMKDIIDASASAENSGGGWLMIILLIIGAIIVGFVAIYFGGIKILLSPSFWFLVSTCALIGCGFGVLGYFMDWWPYKDIDSKDPPEDQADDEQYNKTWLYVFLGGAGAAFFADVVCVVIMKILSGKHPKPVPPPKTPPTTPASAPATPTTPVTPTTPATPAAPATPTKPAAPAKTPTTPITPPVPTTPPTTPIAT